MGSNETILITGGTGYVGKNLLACLKTHADDWKYDVVVLSRDPDSFQKNHPELLFKGLRFLKGDIENFSLPDDLSVDLIIHGATSAEAPTTAEEAKKTWASSYGGTQRLTREILRRVQAGMPKPRHLVYLSSGAVYGPQPANLFRIPETFVREPLPEVPPPSEAYGEAKLASSTWLAAFSAENGIPVSVARIFACAGPYIPFAGRFALGQFIRSAMETGKIVISGDGTAVRTFLPTGELAEWLFKILRTPKKSGIYNLGSDSELTIRQVAEVVKERFSEAGIDVKIEIQGNGSGSRYVPSILKVTEAFGFKPEIDSTEAIRQTVDWALKRLKKHGK